MDHMVSIDKEPYMEQCKTWVNDILKKAFWDLDDAQLTKLTVDIMDTALQLGGAYEQDTIEYITREYIKSGGIERSLNL